MVSRVFPCKFQHFQTASVSGHSVCFIFKTCQIIADTSMIRQFHEFFNLNFGGFLRIGPTVWCQRTSSLFAGYIQSIMLQWTPLRIISLHVGKSWSPKPGFFSLAPPVVQLYLGSLSNWLEEIKLAAVHICRKPACRGGALRRVVSRRHQGPTRSMRPSAAQPSSPGYHM